MSRQLYMEFADVFNRRAYDQLGDVLADGFVDHHPGLVDVTGLAPYRKNLAAVIDALEMVASPEVVVAVDDKVFTRIRLSGRHVGTFLGLGPTGNAVSWYTHELWRTAGGRFVERWAVDDLLTLLGQMGVPLPGWDTA